MADLASIGLWVMRTAWLWAFGLYCIGESIVRSFLPRDYFKKDIKGKIVLVTGGGSGIGRLLCLKFAQKGAKIVTWDINAAGNDETVRMVEDLGTPCKGYIVDLCDRKDIYATAARVKQEFGKVEILVNNAGVVTGKSLMNSPDNDIIQTFEVNCLSHFWTVKAFLGDMLLSNTGHIVTIASMAGWLGKNKMVDYSSSKFAAVGFDESLRQELKAQGATGIKTTVVNPAFVDTGLFKGAQSKIVLTPDWVASETVDATLMDVPVLMLPKRMRVFVILKLILPEKLQFKLATVNGMTSMMNTFVGRKKD